MDRLRRAAILTRLIQELRKQGSWCGETHIQKATLFLQELLGVPLEFEFILYKHGPFSFDLKDDLVGLRADGLIHLEPQWPYGPQVKASEQAAYIQKLYSRTLKNYERQIGFVAKKLGGKGVSDLERVATAYFVTDRFDLGPSVTRRAEKVSDLKPHIAIDAAEAAVAEVDGILSEAAAYV